MAKKEILFKVVTGAVDRHGTVIDAAGMDLAPYRRNPVVLFNHDYDKVIGRAPGIALQGGEIVAPVVFDDADPFAAAILRKVEAGYLSGASAGFIVHKEERGRILQSELVEFSVVTVPSNPDALAMRAHGRPVRFAPAARHVRQGGRRGTRPATRAEYMRVAVALQPIITREVLRAFGVRR